MRILLKIILMMLCTSWLPLQADEVTKVLLHVTSGAKTSHFAAIANANYLQKKYGKENVIVEIVANATGVGIANARNSINTKVKSLIDNGVRLSVCSTSLNRMKKKGKDINLVDGSIHIPNGIVRVIELQKQGYIYVHP